MLVSRNDHWNSDYFFQQRTRIMFRTEDNVWDVHNDQFKASGVILSLLLCSELIIIKQLSHWYCRLKHFTSMASKYSESPPLPRRKFRQYQVNSGQPRKEVIAEEGPQRLSLSILSNLNSPLSLARKQLNQFIFSSKTINQLQTKALSKNSGMQLNIIVLLV